MKVPRAEEGASGFVPEERHEETAREEAREADGGDVFQPSPLLHRQSAHHNHPAAWGVWWGGGEEA